MEIPDRPPLNVRHRDVFREQITVNGVKRKRPKNKKSVSKRKENILSTNYNNAWNIIVKLVVSLAFIDILMDFLNSKMLV